LAQDLEDLSQHHAVVAPADVGLVGAELINFYNDPYLSIIGGKHPGALGQPARKVWAEIWDQIQGRIAAAMRGDASYSEAELLVMHRNGYDEETYYTFSFSPVPTRTAASAGIVCANTDDTDRVIGARRLALLREIASRTWDADSVDEVYALSARALAADSRDMPFAWFTVLMLMACMRACAAIAVSSPDMRRPRKHRPGTRLALADQRCGAGGRRAVSRLGEKFGELPKGPWNDAAQEALMLPLSVSADTAPRGVLILPPIPIGAAAMTVSRISPRWWRARSLRRRSISRPLKRNASAPNPPTTWRWRSSIAAASNATELLAG
jgi:hypothetical protein